MYFGCYLRVRGRRGARCARKIGAKVRSDGSFRLRWSEIRPHDYCRAFRHAELSRALHFGYVFFLPYFSFKINHFSGLIHRLGDGDSLVTEFDGEYSLDELQL